MQRGDQYNIRITADSRSPRSEEPKDNGEKKKGVESPRSTSSCFERRGFDATRKSHPRDEKEASGGRRCTIGVRTLSALALFVTAFVTAAATLGTVLPFSIQGAEEMAKTTSEVVTATCSSNLLAKIDAVMEAADSLQFQLATGPSSYLPHPDDDPEGPNDWWQRWVHISLLYGRSKVSSTFSLNSALVISFDDGRWVACTPPSAESSFTTLCTVADQPTVVGGNLRVMRVFIHNPRSGKLLMEKHNDTDPNGTYYTTKTPSVVNWNQRVPHELFAKRWLPTMTFSAFPPRPVFTFLFAIVNSSMFTPAVGGFQLEFARFKEVIDPLRHSSSAFDTTILLLGENDRVIATSEDEGYTKTPVSDDYTLSSDEIARQCVQTEVQEELQRYVFCQRSIGDYGLPANYISQSESDGFIANVSTPLESSNSGGVRLITADDGVQYWVSVTNVFSPLAPDVPFRIVVMIPHNEVISAVMTGSYIAIGVVCGIFIAIVIIATIIMTFALRPLSEVASGMQSGAYLEPEEHDRKGPPCQGTLSYLTDVADIQAAWFAMVDELKSLRGYIPEHVRNEVKKKAANKAGTSSSGRDGGVSLAAAQPQHPASTLDQRYAELDEAAAQQEAVHINNNKNNNNKGSGGADPDALFKDLLTASLGGARSDHVHPNGARSTARRGGGGDSHYNLDHDDVDDPHRVADHAYTEVPDSELAARLESLGDLTQEANRRHRPLFSSGPPVFFGDNVLVDRDVTVAVVNIVQFHAFAVVTHGTDLAKHHAAVVSYLQATATRYGGVLDTFSGDKFWVSFNATTKCDASEVSAACFGMEVAATINREATNSTEILKLQMRQRELGESVADPHQARFWAALNGVTVGIATGRAFVGPMGTSAIRRHSIISNAVTEAAALERLSKRFPNVSVMVGGDMIPAIEGYAQYLLLDAITLPGGNTKRRRIASLKAPMCAPGRNISFMAPCLASIAEAAATSQNSKNPLSATTTIISIKNNEKKSSPLGKTYSSLTAAASSSLSLVNRYQPANDLLDAFLEGRVEECHRLIREIQAMMANANNNNTVTTDGSATTTSGRTALVSGDVGVAVPTITVAMLTSDPSSASPSPSPHRHLTSHGNNSHEEANGALAVISSVGGGTNMRNLDEECDNNDNYDDVDDDVVSPTTSNIMPTNNPKILRKAERQQKAPLSVEEIASLALMVNFVVYLLSAQPPVDGRLYCSPLGNLLR